MKGFLERLQWKLSGMMQGRRGADTFSNFLVVAGIANAPFERIVEKPRKQLSLRRKKWTNRKTTRYFKCKGCGQVLSVPRGKGTLRVVCPKCKTETKQKS